MTENTEQAEGVESPSPDLYCAACGREIKQCPGHAEGSLGHEMLADHDRGDHTRCHPNGCPVSRENTLK